MTRYQTLFNEFHDHVERHDKFVARGTTILLSVIDQFVLYLDAPPDACRFARAGGDLNSPSLGRHEAVQLQEDGWFATSLIIREQHPMGGILGFTIFASIEDGSVKLKTREDREFRVKDPTIEPPTEFFDHVTQRILDHLQAAPEKVVAGGLARKIGFI